MPDRILEVGSAGLEGMDAKVKALMSNMVNSETPGYRKSDVVIKSFPTYLEEAHMRSTTQVPHVQGTYYNQNAGTLLRTGNYTDFAIGGNGFFVVETPAGNAYTRDGRFTIDKDGRLLTLAGNYPVLGSGGPIVITPGSKVEFSSEGKILIDGTPTNSIKVVSVKEPSKLHSITGALFKLGEEDEGATVAIDNPRILNGYIEASNVNVIDEMMNLININRAYSINSKIISNRDAMLSKAIDMANPSQ